MRADMAQVIVERPRLLWRPTRKGRVHAFDDLPSHEGLRRRHKTGGEGKRLNENLAPLRRFLASQAGRPWDKVYAEIAAHLRADSAVQQHVRDHLKDFVAITPRRNISGWRNHRRNGLWWQDLYVDPRTGLLCRTDRLPEEKARRHAERRRKDPVERIALSACRELRLIAGLWYEVKLAPLPDPIYAIRIETVTRPLKGYGDGGIFTVEMKVRHLVTAPVQDVVTGRSVAVGPAVHDLAAWRLYRRAQPDRRYAVAKRTLSKQELRRHGVSNTA